MIPPQRSSYLACALVLLALLVYGNAIFHPFVHDDIHFIQQNPHIHEWNNLGDVFFASFTDHPSNIINTYYRPGLEIFYRLEYFLFGLNPAGYHLMNVLLHAMNGLLIFVIFKKLGWKEEPAFAVAALFLVHPVQTEAVACVSGISNVLSLWLCLLSFYFYLLCREKERLLTLAVSLFFFLSAMLCKEQALALAAVIVFCEFLFKGNAVQRIARAGLYLTIALSFWMFRQVIFDGDILASVFNPSLETALRLWSIPKVLVTHLSLLLFPSGLHYYRTVDIFEPSVYEPIVLAVVVLAGTFFYRRLSLPLRPLFAFGAGWFFIFILPTLPVVPLIVESSHVLAAEHFLYFSSIGFFAVIMAAFLALQERTASFKNNPSAVRIIFILVLLVLSVLTVRQNRSWSSELALFQRASAYEPQLGRVRILLGKAYFNKSLWDQAIHEMTIAARIMSSYAGQAKEGEAKTFYLGFLKGTHFDLAQTYAAKGDWQGSKQHYLEALALDPQDSVLYNGLGINALQRRKISEAAGYFQKAVELNSRDIRAMNNLAICLIESGNTQQAEFWLKNILKIDPGFAAARQNLEILLNSRR